MIETMQPDPPIKTFVKGRLRPETQLMGRLLFKSEKEACWLVLVWFIGWLAAGSLLMSVPLTCWCPVSVCLVHLLAWLASVYLWFGFWLRLVFFCWIAVGSLVSRCYPAVASLRFTWNQPCGAKQHCGKGAFGQLSVPSRSPLKIQDPQRRFLST